MLANRKERGHARRSRAHDCAGDVINSNGARLCGSRAITAWSSSLLRRCTFTVSQENSPALRLFTNLSYTPASRWFTRNCHALNKWLFLKVLTPAAREMFPYKSRLIAVSPSVFS